MNGFTSAGLARVFEMRERYHENVRVDNLKLGFGLGECSKIVVLWSDPFE